ncbi:efflux RND transporter periplasmic adaptor subunit, partial [Bacteroidales bacterium OttesenSCG-928-C03]|nr:efflux RND transporter periplasmic adaptor subunit [Bacteroidales bacterium OttesenSCG-928-C03]
KGEAERVIKLYGQESVSQNDYEKAVSGIQQITAKYNAHKNALSDTKLTAPFDGYIHKRYFDESETIGAGMPLFSLISSGTPEVVINIPAKNFIERDNFDNYHCTFSLYPGVEFPLDLLAINQKANLNQLYAMRLKIRSNQGKQMPTPGMSTIVTINLKPGDSDLLTIPVTSVFEKEGSNCVWVYNGDTQTVQLRPIQLVEITSDGKVVVTEGLQAGDIVVSAGIHTLQDGEKVKLLPEVSATNTGGML